MKRLLTLLTLCTALGVAARASANPYGYSRCSCLGNAIASRMCGMPLIHATVRPADRPFRIGLGMLARDIECATRPHGRKHLRKAVAAT